MRCIPTSKTTDGFTLVEMLVVAPIVLLTIGTFIGVLIYLTGETMIARTSNVLAYSVQDSLDTIENDVALSGAFLATNSVTIASPQGYGNNTQAFQNASASTGSMLIINAPVTVDGHTSTRKLLPLANLPHPCNTTQTSQNQVMTYNIVYFVRDNTLWRRTLMPSNYLTRGCGTPWQQPSCAPGQTGTMCRTEDVKVLEGVSTANFKIEYLTSATATTPLTNASNASLSSSSRQLALSTTDTAIITIQAIRSVAGKEVSYTGSMRVTRVGPLSEQVTPVP